MTGFTPKADFKRSGAISIGVYVPKIGGAVISAPGAPTVTAQTYNFDTAPVTAGRRFNVQNSVPGTTRAVKACYLSYDVYGNLVPTAMSSETSVTPATANNGIEVVLDNVPADSLYALIFIDDQVAQVVPTPPATRINSLATSYLGVTVLYEPSPLSPRSADILDVGTGNSPIEATRKPLGLTTGALTHTINYTQIDIPINGMPNDLITTRSDQMVSATFVAPSTRLQALSGEGTDIIGCGCATAMTQLGFKAGNCSGNRVYDLILPGNECYQQLNALFYGNAIHGEASQAVNYSSEEVSNLPFTLKEASSIYFLGNHSLTLFPI